MSEFWKLHRKFLDPVNNLSGVLIRRAVYTPIAGPIKPGQPDILRGDMVQKVWRRQILQLVQDHNVLGSVGITATNCMPSGYYCRPVTRFCGQRYLCPFCHGRYLADIFDRAATVRLQGYVFLGAVQQNRVMTTSAPSLREALRVAVDQLRRQRQHIAPYGAVANVGAVPLKTDGAWKIRAASLFVCSADVVERVQELLVRDKAKIVGTCELGKAKFPLVKLMARTFAYQRQLLQVPVERLIPYVKARIGLRLCEIYQCFRKLKPIADPVIDFRQAPAAELRDDSGDEDAWVNEMLMSCSD